ncbi:MAG: DUF6576 domain-containing protein [Nocardioides sp.]
MSDRFSFRRGYGESDPWFRIGSLDVGTTLLVTFMSIVSFFLFALSPAIVSALALQPADVLSGYLWQVVTWPLANAPDFWSVITIFIFWYFGTELENQVGKQKFAWLLGLTTVTMSAITLALGLLFGGSRPILGGLEALQTVVILIFIAQNLHARFFFNIPAWLIGAIIMVLPVLRYLGLGLYPELLNLLLGWAAAAIIARAQGLLPDLAFIPAVRAPKRDRRQRQSMRRHPSQSQAPRPTVVEGPWLSSGAAGSPQAELDDLLDKISEGGLDSLTERERARLHELRNLLRGE